MLAILSILALGPYSILRQEGWTLHLEPELQSRHPREWAAAKRELDAQLYRIAHVVPDGPLAKLRQVPIWIHWQDSGTECMAYHPGKDWLVQHQMNPDMAKGIEIGNIVRFVSWCYEQPWMVLHELSHAYHDRYLESGFENRPIKERYDAALKEKRFEAVLHWDGRTARHYAATNPMEFFAESSEAYFGQNDFYPVVRAELRASDPATHALLVSIWGEPQKRS
jgi:hypothetical protein